MVDYGEETVLRNEMEEYKDENAELRAENERLKKTALDDARAEVCEGIGGLEHVIREQSKEIERLKNLAELHRQAIEKDVSAHDRAEIQAFYDNIASKEPSLAHQANTVQVNAIARLNAEVERLKAQLAWYEKREPLFRNMVGAVEDAGVWRDEGQTEWRALVDFEMSERKP